MNTSFTYDAKKITENYELTTFLDAAILQAYLRLNNEYTNYFPKNKDYSISQFIEDSKAVLSNISFPFEYEVYLEENQIIFTHNETTPLVLEWFLKCLNNMISEMLTKEYVSEINLLTPEEEKAVYSYSTGPASNADLSTTWIDIFEKHVANTPDKIAVVDKSVSLSYKELNNASNKLADYLLSKNLKANSFVVVHTKRNVNFMIAIIGINKAGHAYVPIDSEYPENIQNYICENSKARIILDDKKINEVLWSTPDNIENINMTQPDSLAYMIYTSGTTGNPKGVMIKHSSIKQFASWIIPFLNLNANSRNLVHSSFSFDASTMDTLYPIIVGGTVYILDEKTRMNLKALAEYINCNEITGLCTTYSLGREFLTRYEVNLEYIALGGEAFLQFGKVKHKIFNAYGPTEFTVMSSGHLVDQDKNYLPPIGGPAPGTIQMVMDCFMKPLPLGFPGELCLSGQQISAGYFNNDEATSRSFVTLDNGLAFYRTGDLVKYNSDRELDYLGRIDRQVKVRGYRIEPAQIETQVQQEENISECVVSVKKINGFKKLCLYYVSDRDISIPKLKQSLSTKLTEYMIPELYKRIESIPKTQNGKIDFDSLPDIDFEKRTSYTAPRSDLEKLFCKKIEQILKLSKVGINDNFFDLGGDSLSAMELLQELNLPDFEITELNNKTIKETVASYEKHIQVFDSAVSLKKEGLPLVGAQKYFYNIYEEFSDYTSCNLHGLYKMNPSVSKYKLLASINRVIDSHPVFRTRFYLEKDTVYQRIDENKYEEPVSYESVTREELNELLDTLVVPYNLFDEPLYRIKVFHVQDEGLYVFTDFHHIICDGYALSLFWDDLVEAYKGNKMLNDRFLELLNEQADSLCEQSLPKLNPTTILPFDYKEPIWVPYEEREDCYQIELEMTPDEVDKICEKYSSSADVFFMTCYLLALSKETGSNEVCTSWIHTGRFTGKALNSIGLMINLFFVNIDIDDSLTLDELLDSVSIEKDLSKINREYNGYYSYDLLHNPVGCFQYHEYNLDQENSLVDERIELPNPRFKPAFYFEIEVSNTGDKLFINCVNNNYHYKKETIATFMETYRNIITNCVKGKEKVDEIKK